MIVGPPGVPTTIISAPSGSRTMLGVIDESIRLPGTIALFSPSTRPNWLGWPGDAAKSSISLFSRKPAPATVTALPKPLLIVVVTDAAAPQRSTTE